MNRIIFIATLFFIAISASSQNGGELTFEVKIIDEVRAVMYLNPNDINSDTTIMVVPFENGGFKLIFPEKMDENLLYPIAHITIKGIHISNKKAKTNTVEGIFAYKNNEPIGSFKFLAETSDSFIYTYFQYVDNDVSMKGIGITGTFVYDLDLKKGWNIVYIISSNSHFGKTDTFTTQKPDANFIWHYGCYNLFD